MRLKTILPLMAGISLIVAPVAASAQQQPVRASAQTEEVQDLRGRGGGGSFFIILLALAAALAGIAIAASGNDRPNSP